MEVVKFDLETLVAQLSDNGLELGGLFDKLKIDVNKYEEVINNFKKLSSFDEFIDTNGKIVWNDISEAIGGADERAMSYFKTMDDGKGTINNSSASIKGMATHLQSTGQMFDFAAVKATLLNTALNAGIFLAVSFAIQGVVWAIDKLVVTSDEAIEKANELKDSYKNITEEISSDIDTIKGLEDEFNKLSKGVDDYGNCISLSADEYERYQEIVQQITDISPSLITGYNEEGKAIANKNGLIEESIKLLKAEQKQKLLDQTSSEKIKDIGKGAVEEYKKAKKDLNKHKRDGLNDIIGGMTDIGFWGDNEDAHKKGAFIADFFGVSEYYENNKRGLENIIDSNDFNEKIEELYKEASLATDVFTRDDLQKFEEYISKRNILNSSLENYSKELNPTLQLVPQSEDVYESFSNAQKNFLTNYINGFKIASDTSEEEIEQMKNDILYLTQTIGDSDASNLMEKLFALPNDLSADEYLSQYSSLIESIIKELDGTDGTGLTDEQEIKIRARFSIKDEESRIKTMKDDLQSKLQDEFDGKVGELSIEDLEIAYEHISVDDSVPISWDELIAKIEEYKESQNSIEPITFSDIFALEDSEGNANVLGDLNKQIDEIQNAYNALKDAIDNYSSTGIITIDQYQEIIAQGSKFLDYLKLENGQLSMSEEGMYQLAEARLVEMQAQMVQGIVDNVKGIQTEADANVYLASTNYDLAQSYHELAESQLTAWYSQSTISNKDEVLAKAQNDIAKIRELTSNVNLGSIGGNSKSSSKSSTKELDFFEYRLTEIDQAIEKVKTHMENFVGSGAKNLSIDSLLQLDKTKQSNLQEALSYYTDKASEELAKIPANLQEAVKNGALGIHEVDGELGETIENYRKWADKVDEVSVSIEELNAEMRQLELDKFNNTLGDYTKLFDQVEQYTAKVNNLIDTQEKQQGIVSKNAYQDLIVSAKQELKLLQDQKKALEQQMNNAVSSGNVPIGSDEWTEMESAIEEVDNEIITCIGSISDFQDEINNLTWENFDRMTEAISHVSDEVNTLIELMDENNAISDNGAWTEDGIAQLGLLANQYENSTYLAHQYGEEINKLQESYNKGEVDLVTYTDKLRELQSSQWDAVESAESAKDSIIDLNRTRIDKLIDQIDEATDSFNEMIEARKEALQDESDEHDYQKDVQAINKEILALENQKNALIGNNSQEAQMKRLQLDEQIAEKIEERDEMAYDHSVDVRLDALDKAVEANEKEAESKKETLENSLKNTESVLAQSTELAKQNAQIVYNMLITMGEQYGIKISDTLTTTWKAGENAIASYGEVLSPATSAFIGQLEEIRLKNVENETQADNVYNKLLETFNMTDVTLDTELSTLKTSLNEDFLEASYLHCAVNDLFNGLSADNLVSQFNNIASVISETTTKIDELIVKTKESEGGFENQIRNAEYVSKLLDDVSTSYEDISRKSALISGNVKDIVLLQNNVSQPKSYKIVDGNGNVKKELGQIDYLDAQTQLNLYKKDNPSIKGLKIQAFSKGGVISKDKDDNILQKIANSVREDTIVSAQEGERILTRAQNENFEQLIKITPELLETLKKNFTIPNISIPNYSALNNVQRRDIAPKVETHIDALVKVDKISNGDLKEMERIANKAVAKLENNIYRGYQRGTGGRVIH